MSIQAHGKCRPVVRRESRNLSLGKEAIGNAEYCPIPHLTDYSPTPLAFAQECAWGQDPNQRLSLLPLLPETERTWQIAYLDHATPTAPSGACVHDLIREQAAIRPDVIAVECGAQRLTYAELDYRSDRLARVLSMLDIGTDSPVAVCVDRSVESAVALVGILKAGAAYLPLDPEAPEALLMRIIRESCPRALLTRQSATRNLSFYIKEMGDLGAGLELPMIYLDAEVWDGMACERAGLLTSCPGPGSLACVIYTEDFEGYLKEVQIPHRVLGNLVGTLQERLEINEGDTLLAVNETSSGSAMLDLLLPLTIGARTVIASDASLSSSIQLRRRCEQVRPKILQASPTVLRSLINAGWEGHRNLTVLCGGEDLPEELSEPLLKRCGSLWNLYGMTKATIWSAASRVESPGSHVIGKPLGNPGLRLLDRH